MPISITTFSRERSSSATRTASPGLPLSSRDDDLDRAAEHAARGVDLVARELHALLVRLEEGRKRLVAVELAQLDRLRGERGGHERGEEGRGRDQKAAEAIHVGSGEDA